MTRPSTGPGPAPPPVPAGAEAGWAHAVLVAAGRGERLGGSLPKGRVLLAGRPLFLHALITLLAHPRIRDLVLLVPPEAAEQDTMRALLEEWLAPGETARVSVAAGGAARRESVLRGLEFLEERGTRPEALVLIHDAARPLLSPALVARCLEAIALPLSDNGQTSLPGLEPIAGADRFAAGVVPGLPVRETLKLVYEERVVVTQPRENLWAVQTPQVFRFGPLLRAHRRAARYGVSATDDAALLEWLGLSVRIVLGDPANLKITFPEDLALAERLLAISKRWPEGGGRR